MTLNTVAHRRGMNFPFDVGSLFVGVTTQTKTGRSGGGELDAGDVFVNANFVAGLAAHLNRRMHRLALGFVLMTFKTLGVSTLNCSGTGCVAANVEPTKPKTNRAITQPRFKTNLHP